MVEDDIKDKLDIESVLSFYSLSRKFNILNSISVAYGEIREVNEVCDSLNLGAIVSDVVWESLSWSWAAVDNAVTYISGDHISRHELG